MIYTTENNNINTKIYYVLSTINELSLKDIYDLVKEVSVESSEDIMTIADKLRKEGMEKGNMEEKIEVARNLLSIGIEIFFLQGV